MTDTHPGPSAGEALLHAVTASAEVLDGPLEPIGPRPGADRGDPRMSIRTLYETPDGSVQVGVWECTPGGWSIVERADTEVVHVLRGRAVITDADGTTHELGPGSVLTLPRGWSGRWDIGETLRKLYVTTTA